MEKEYFAQKKFDNLKKEELTEQDELFCLTPKQKMAFEELRKAYKKCESLGIYFYNCYSSLGGVDKNKIIDYSDKEKGEILNRGQNCLNEIKIPYEWTDDIHYFHPKNSN